MRGNSARSPFKFVIALRIFATEQNTFFICSPQTFKRAVRFLTKLNGLIRMSCWTKEFLFAMRADKNSQGHTSILNPKKTRSQEGKYEEFNTNTISRGDWTRTSENLSHPMRALYQLSYTPKRSKSKIFTFLERKI